MNDENSEITNEKYELYNRIIKLEKDMAYQPPEFKNQAFATKLGWILDNYNITAKQ